MNTEKSWLEENRALVLFLLFTFSLLVRYLTAEYLDLGGDNAQKWMQAHRIAEGLGVTHWYNHSMRWTIVLPLAGLIKMFGANPLLTYVQPFFYASISAIFICLIGERLHSFKLGVGTALLSILLPQMTQTGSSMWPGVFEMGFISALIWGLMVWIDERKVRWLIFAGLMFFIGWGARVTMLYIYPGAALLIWLTSRDLKAVIIFTAFAAIPCFAEWGYFWYDSGNPLGRIGLLSTTRGSNPVLLITLKEYLLIFTIYGKFKGLLPVLLITLGTSVYALWCNDQKIKGLAALHLIYMFLSLYMISGVEPLKVANRFGPRNWSEIAPYGFMILLWCLIKLKKDKPKVAVGIYVVLLLAFTGFSIKKIPSENALAQLGRDYKLLVPVTTAGLPVKMVYEPWGPNLIEKFFIDTFAKKMRKKEMSEKDVLRDMVRNRARIASLFVHDVRQWDAWRKSKLTRLERYVYLLHAPSHPTRMRPGAESLFGRKEHRARLIAP